MTGQSDLGGDDDIERCTPCQLKAIAHVQERARRARGDARARLATILSRTQRVEDDLPEALRGLQRDAKVVLHFHPDRITNNGQTVAHRLLAEGLYRSQFETGISNGSPTAYPGGERDIWERELFGGAYHSHARGLFGAFFHLIPHVFIKGPVDVSEAQIIDWNEPPADALVNW